MLKLRQLRRGRELTQAATAKRVGIAVSTYNAVEQGHVTPVPDYVWKLAREFGCHVEDLFEWVEVRS